MAISLKILGIYREEKFSNRAIDADRAIMDAVLKVLESGLSGATTISTIRPEDDAHKIKNSNYDLIFSMAQDEQVLKDLESLESQGTVVVNSSRAIRNCYRHKLSELLSDEAFSYPRFLPLDLNSDIVCDDSDFLNSPGGFWVKRGDFHALVDQDVVYVDQVDNLPPILAGFKKRGVDSVILQENCQGELFKFYGVQDSYFNLRYMGKTTKDRYVTIPGNPDIKFDHVHLEKIVHMAARILELDYFGGDCIVTDTGKIHFIDFNDWPSFRTCREEVAPFMASYALKKIDSEVLNANSVVQ
jgi:hypothetical protein